MHKGAIYDMLYEDNFHFHMNFPEKGDLAICSWNTALSLQFLNISTILATRSHWELVPLEAQENCALIRAKALKPSSLLVV